MKNMCGPRVRQEPALHPKPDAGQILATSNEITLDSSYGVKQAIIQDLELL